MNEAFLGLGGNKGDRLVHLSECRKAIASTCGRIIAESGIYETEAWGLATELKFLNQVIKIETVLSAEKLLETLMQIEHKFGRSRSGTGYEDRSVDLDILFYNSEVIKTKKLEIPHPRLHLRKFVLIPLNEIAGDFVHPGLNKNIKELLETCPDTLEVELFQATK